MKNTRPPPHHTFGHFLHTLHHLSSSPLLVSTPLKALVTPPLTHHTPTGDITFRSFCSHSALFPHTCTYFPAWNFLPPLPLPLHTPTWVPLGRSQVHSGLFCTLTSHPFTTPPPPAHRFPHHTPAHLQKAHLTYKMGGRKDTGGGGGGNRQNFPSHLTCYKTFLLHRRLHLTPHTHHLHLHATLSAETLHTLHYLRFLPLGWAYHRTHLPPPPAQTSFIHLHQSRDP